MNDVVVDKQKLISTTSASEISGYSKDYIGQLCREEKLTCRRVSGHWYVSEESIHSYKEVSASLDNNVAKKDDVESENKTDTNIIARTIRDDTFDHGGVEYISTLRGAELTGYAQDYVGQLARSGEIVAQKKGRRWFVGKASLLEHKKHNDNLLASVQAKASGAHKNTTTSAVLGSPRSFGGEGVPVDVDIRTSTSLKDLSFNVRYVSETDKELVPKLKPRKPTREPYASGDMYEITIAKNKGKTKLETEDSIYGTRSRKPLYTESRIGTRVNISGNSEEKEVVFTPEIDLGNQGSILISRIAITLIVVFLALSAYLFGRFEWIPNLSFETTKLENFVRILSDSYGDILPGTKFIYMAK